MAEFAHKCNTCLAAFPSMDLLKDHYRGDWHVLNSKRRAAGQPPVRREQFLQVVAAKASSAAAAPSSSAGGAKKAPVKKPMAKSSAQSQSQSQPLYKREPATQTLESLSTRTVVNGQVITEDEAEEEIEGTEKDAEPQATPVVPTAAATSTETVTAAVTADEESEDDGEGEDEDDGDYETIGSDDSANGSGNDDSNEDNEDNVALGPHISLFDDKDCETTEKCIEYMSHKFGFFIPDLDYLEDLPGLLDYLGEKIKLGHICLFCQKRFSTARACQHHMIGKSHCKIAYEEGIDMEEVEDFYDFSSTYEDLDRVEYDENGEVIQEEMEVSHTGELVLPDGRVLGHRAFRRYYKQYYRASDTRDCVIAQQREELLRLESKFGMSVVSGKECTDVSSLSDVEVMAALMTYQRHIRKGQMIEQRAALQRESQDQRREYKSKVNKLRSSEITTAKIRDYHGMLK